MLNRHQMSRPLRAFVFFPETKATERAVSNPYHDGMRKHCAVDYAAQIPPPNPVRNIDCDRENNDHLLGTHYCVGHG